MSSHAKATSPLAARIAAIRRFNRFYTRLVGALDEGGYLHSPFSLTEGRVLFELAHRDAPTASMLAAELGLDAGYLSRLLQRLHRRRLVTRTRSPHDGRQSHLSLTAAGRAAFRKLDGDADALVEQLLATLDDTAQRRLIESIRTVSALLGDPAPDGPRAAPPYLLRPPGPADYGWIIQSHGDIYAREFGWGPRFLSLVARVIADYVDDFDPALERCWIAERDGQNVGSVFVAKDTTRPGVAKLRMLLVLPSARGLGIGKRLVDECTRFAREAGYHTLSLWTNSVLTTARQIYADAGYVLVRTEVHDTFGKPLTAETWELTL
ncbi:MAG: MarR family transcriptional regulator [Gemmatimonadetes bacterium]|nr:MAG: MarR family transcriptional regulator [Gemmatimonadota bacterium]